MGSEVDDDPYAEAALYDLEYAGHDEDVSWYILQSLRSRGRVLELGCGTGRLTLPIARAGISVVGIDRAPSMLRALQQKLQDEEPDVQARITPIEGDYFSAEICGPFGAVLWPFNALHHAAGPAQLRKMLDRAWAWLRPGGLLALDCYLPDLELYDRDPNIRYEPRVFQDSRTGHTLHSWEQGWWDAANRVHHVLYVYRHPDGREERTRLRLRMYEQDELRTLISDAGFTLEHQASDFQGGLLTPEALKFVALARRP